MYAITKQITSKSIIIGLAIRFRAFIVTFATIFAATTFATTTYAANQSSSGLGQSSEAGNQQETTGDPTESALQNSAPSVPALQQQERSFDQLLAQNSKEDEVVWLDIKYPGAASTLQSIALRSDAKTPISQGAALIIPDTTQHADWPTLVHPLRNSLPFAGWTTLALTLPWPALEKTPERQLDTKRVESYASSPELRQVIAAGSRSFAQANNTTNTDPSNSPETDPNAPTEEESVDINLKDAGSDHATTPPYAERALVHIQAGIDYLAQQGFQNTVVIAIGESAELAVSYIQSRENEVEEKGFSLVLIDPILSRKNNNDFALALGNEFPAPVLDFYTSSSQAQSQKAKLRKASARVGNFNNYQQIKMGALQIKSAERFLNKRINDWLKRHAPGQEQTN